MIVNLEALDTLAQVEAFLEGTQAVAFAVASSKRDLVPMAAKDAGKMALS